MAKVQFNLDKRKYMLEFLPDCQAKVTRLDGQNKFITVRYFSSTKVRDFMRYVRSLDFSKLKNNELYTNWKVRIAVFHGQQEKIFENIFQETLDNILY